MVVKALNPASVLVLGGSGFIGRSLVKRLRQEGLGVRMLVRDGQGRAQSLAGPGVELVQGDFIDTASVQTALDGIGHVFHLARSEAHTWDDCLRRDVEPTRRLAELCCARGIRLYYASSIAIYDGGRAGEVISEATPPSPQAMRMNAYARAKVTCEGLLSEMHRQRGLQVLVLRPGIVIGQGGNPLHPGVGAWSSASVCRPWGDGRQRLPFVLVDDCADAMVRAIQLPRIAGESFNLGGDPCLSGSDYLDALERITGKTIRRQSMPTAGLFARSLAKWCVQTLARSPGRRLPSYSFIEGLSCRAHYCADLAKQRLGWVPTADAATLIERGLAIPLSSGSLPEPEGTR